MRIEPPTHLLPVLSIAISVCIAACGDDESPPSTPPPNEATCAGQTVDVWVNDEKLCVYEYAANLGAARGLAFAPNGDLFVVAQAAPNTNDPGKIIVLSDGDGDGTSAESEHATFTETVGLNHGIAFSRDAAYIYASSATTVYRWTYTTGARRAAGPPEVVVANIPSGGHVSRTLVFDSKGRLYVSVGSAYNVDTDPTDLQTRAQIRRFDIPASIPSGGLDYATGEVVASGMRNETGLYVDARDRIWGVENGRDMLRTDANDIHNDNPGEEINLVDGTGANYYGYPSCFSEFKLPGGKGAGTQWADPTLAAAALKTDDWCRDIAQVHPPVFALPAHWAPLGILEYQGSLMPWGHDLIVAAHGSWNSDDPVGRVLARLHRDGDKITSFEPILGENGGDGLRQGQWSVRPVDVREAADGSVYFSDDEGGHVFKISYAH